MPPVSVATRSGSTRALTPPEVRALREALDGELLAPDDAGYDAARRVWNGMIDRRPALIARCASTADVAAAVNVAREKELLLSVRGGGHSVAGNAVCDRGLMVDLSQLKQIVVDGKRRTAHAGAGVRLGEFDRATAEQGLATTLGIASDTGIAGLTLGGGYGWLNGRHGLACDNLVGAEVVTADGRVLAAGPQEDPDLFWGLRGGGGNFGIVTRFDYRLHPVDRVLGGRLLFPLTKAREVLTVVDRFLDGAPDQLSAACLFAKAPDGTPVVAVVAVWCGPLDEGERALEPLRSVTPALEDTFAPLRYVEMQSALDENFLPRRHYYWKTSLIRRITPGALDVLVHYGERLPTPFSVIYLQQLHGAAARVSPTATAFPHRFNHYDCGPLFAWEDPNDSARCIALARDVWSSLGPHFEPRVYLSNLGEETDKRTHEALAQNYARAVALKDKYDPTNLFRLNPNIVPRGDA